MPSSILGRDTITVPIGGDADRPTFPNDGAIRFNTDSGMLEVYDGSEWSIKADRVTSFKNSNTALGKRTFESLGGGNFNTASGERSLRDNTTGDDNVANGVYALQYNTTGSRNTAIGTTAITTATVASDMTAVGYDALRNAKKSGTKTPNKCTAIGANSLYNVNGAFNTAVGFNALRDTTTAFSNTAVGHNAGATLSANGNTGSGGYNVAIGTRALGTNTRKSSDQKNNVAIGYTSLRYNDGIGNTVIGYSSGGGSTTANHNVAIGQNSTFGNSTRCTIIGSDVSIPGDSTNVIVIGANASNGAAGDHTVTLGDGNIGNLRCADDTISSFSDRRDKEDIIDLNYGLNFINDLRPVSFSWNHRDGIKQGVVDFGFIAQELDEVQIKHGTEDYTRLVNHNNPDRLEADPMKTYPIMVKAIQELSAEVENLKSQLANKEN